MRSPDGAVVVFASGVHVANLDEGAANWHLGRSKGDPQGPTAMLALISSTLSFNGAAPMLQPAPQSASPVMKAIGEIGVTPPLGVYDPLNLLAEPVTYPRRSYRRYVELEIKHGRIAMLACLGVITTEAGIRWPGYLSKSLDLKFSDIPGGAFDSYAAVPALGWLQIVAFCIFLELAYGATDPSKEPGDIGGATWVRCAANPRRPAAPLQLVCCCALPARARLPAQSPGAHDRPPPAGARAGTTIRRSSSSSSTPSATTAAPP